MRRLARLQRILLEVGDQDLEWEIDRFKVKGDPSRSKTMKGHLLGRLPRAATGT